MQVGGNGVNKGVAARGRVRRGCWSRLNLGFKLKYSSAFGVRSSELRY